MGTIHDKEPEDGQLLQYCRYGLPKIRKELIEYEVNGSESVIHQLFDLLIAYSPEDEQLYFYPEDTGKKYLIYTNKTIYVRKRKKYTIVTDEMTMGIYLYYIDQIVQSLQSIEQHPEVNKRFKLLRRNFDRYKKN